MCPSKQPETGEIEEITMPKEGIDPSFILEVYHDLQVVVKSWPNLPEHIKAAIQALIRTCA
jgi:hypothetical protein